MDEGSKERNVSGYRHETLTGTEEETHTVQLHCAMLS